MPTRSDAWGTLPNLSGVTSGDLESGRAGDPGRMYPSSRAGEIDNVAGRIQNMPRARIYSTLSVTGINNTAYKMGFNSVEYDTDGMAVLLPGTTGVPAAGLKISTPGLYWCKGRVTPSDGSLQQGILVRSTGGAALRSIDASTGAGYNMAPFGWTPVSFRASYSDYGAGFQTCQFMIDGFGFVHLRGLFKFTPIGSYAAIGPIIDLPVGARPANSEIFLAQGSSGAAAAFRMDINPTGTVTAGALYGSNWTGDYMSFSGITFMQAGGGNGGIYSPSGYVRCNKGDQIELWASTQGATDFVTDQDNCYLEACMVSTYGSDNQ